MNIADLYIRGQISGWLGAQDPILCRDEFQMFVGQGLIKDDFKIINQTRATAGQKAMLYDLSRKVLGRDLNHTVQLIGSCVSHGSFKTPTEYLMCSQILKGDRLKFREVFSPYGYGTGRNYVGKNKIGRGDGSLGSWMAVAIQKYGVLFSDDENVPPFSKQVEISWGDSNSRADLDKFVDLGQERPVKTVARIKTWDELVAALVNGYAVAYCGSVGFEMLPQRNGFHRRGRNWNHSMAIIGVDDSHNQPYGIIKNSWPVGCHGQLHDFATGEALPDNCIRAYKKDIVDMLNYNETYVYSAFDGFIEQDLSKDLFNVIR